MSTGLLRDNGLPAWGCLPRNSRFAEKCRPAADRVPLVPENQWDAIAGQLGQGLRPYAKKILYQNGVGSCATESTTQGVMVSRAFAGLPFVLLNPLFIYFHTSGGRDNGSSIDDNLEFVKEFGIAPESVWPRSKGWRTKPSPEAYAAAKAFRIEEYWDVASIAEMVSTLLLPEPVVFGADRHSVLAVAHKGSYPEVANSYDVDWGDQGFGKWCSYAKINWGYGAFALRVVRQG